MVAAIVNMFLLSQVSKSKQHGFTLIEAMIVLVIIVAVTAFAAPSMKTILGQSEIAATTNQLVYSLQMARSEAIKRSGPVGLCASKTSLADEPQCDGEYRHGWIVYSDTNLDGNRNDGEEVFHRVEELSAVFVLTPDTVFNKQVYFNAAGTSQNPTGVPLSGDITLDYRKSGEGRVVSIAGNGRISTAMKVENETDVVP